jgi:hypothetical protein
MDVMMVFLNGSYNMLMKHISTQGNIKIDKFDK